MSTLVVLRCHTTSPPGFVVRGCRTSTLHTRGNDDGGRDDGGCEDDNGDDRDDHHASVRFGVCHDLARWLKKIVDRLQQIIQIFGSNIFVDPL